MQSEYMSCQVEVIDKDLCFRCKDFQIDAYQAFGNDEIIYRRYECLHFKRCKALIEKFIGSGINNNVWEDIKRGNGISKEIPKPGESPGTTIER